MKKSLFRKFSFIGLASCLLLSSCQNFNDQNVGDITGEDLSI